MSSVETWSAADRRLPRRAERPPTSLRCTRRARSSHHAATTSGRNTSFRVGAARLTAAHTFMTASDDAPGRRHVRDLDPGRPRGVGSPGPRRARHVPSAPPRGSTRPSAVPRRVLCRTQRGYHMDRPLYLLADGGERPMRCGPAGRVTRAAAMCRAVHWSGTWRSSRRGLCSALARARGSRRREPRRPRFDRVAVGARFSRGPRAGREGARRRERGPRLQTHEVVGCYREFGGVLEDQQPLLARHLADERRPAGRSCRTTWPPRRSRCNAS